MGCTVGITWKVTSLPSGCTQHGLFPSHLHCKRSRARCVRGALSACVKPPAPSQACICPAFALVTSRPPASSQALQVPRSRQVTATFTHSFSIPAFYRATVRTGRIPKQRRRVDGGTTPIICLHYQSGSRRRFRRRICRGLRKFCSYNTFDTGGSIQRPY